MMPFPDQPGAGPSNAPKGFVDIHTHLVPGVDDGAASPEDAEALLSAARRAGTTLLAATPHVYPGVQTDEEIEKLLQVRDQWIEDVNRRFAGIRVLAGAEIHCTHDLSRVLTRFNHRLSLNGGNYILLEFPFDILFPGVDDLLFHLQQDGWVPIIAHPERNAVIQRNSAVLARMVRAGALAQVNAGSLDGSFGFETRRSALDLLRLRLAHVVASDAHWPKERPADLSGVRDVLSDPEPGEADRLLRRNPERILQNRDIEPAPEYHAPATGGRSLISRLIRHLQGGL